MSRAAGETVWEIPDSEDERSALVLDYPDNISIISTSSDSEDEYSWAKRPIESFFPKGKGLLNTTQLDKRAAHRLPTPRSLSPQQPKRGGALQTSSTRTESPTIASNEDIRTSTESETSLDDQPIALRRSKRILRKPGSQARRWSTTTPESIASPTREPVQQPTPGSVIPIPTHQKLKPTRKIYRQSRRIQPWSAEELGVQNLQTYNTVVEGIDAVLKLYRSRGEQPRVDPEKQEPLQFPRPRKDGKKIVRYCRCLKERFGRRVETKTRQCYDPSCEVILGWYHLSCLSEEELRDMASSSTYIKSL
jgi:hypothetical protein